MLISQGWKGEEEREMGKGKEAEKKLLSQREGGTRKRKNEKKSQQSQQKAGWGPKEKRC